MRELWREPADAALIEEAARFRDMTPEERIEVFKDILSMVGAAWSTLSEEEQRRRLRIGDALEARREPWWRNGRRAETGGGALAAEAADPDGAPVA